MRKHIIRKCSSPVTSPILFVEKKNGSLRPCVNLTYVNDFIEPFITAPPPFPLIQQRLICFKYFFVIDLKDAFYNLFIDRRDQWLTSFRCPFGTYCFTRPPFGLNVAPGIFQFFIETLLRDFLFSSLLVYIDDIILFSNSKSHLTAQASSVIGLLHSNNIRENPQKSQGFTTTPIFLRHRFSLGTCQPVVPTETLENWPLPTTKKQMQSFLGLCNFFRNFVPGYASLAKPLYESTNAKNPSLTLHKSFDQLKHAVICAISTSQPIHPTHQTIYADASQFGMSAILLLDDKPSHVFSKQLNAAQRNYDTTERELLAIVESLKSWHHVIRHDIPLQVFTDNLNNATIRKDRPTNRRWNRHVLFLASFHIQWSWISTTENPADPWSRHPLWET